MLTLLLALAAAAQEPSPAPPAAPAAPLDLDALPLAEAAPIRCALAFAVVSDWRRAGDKRAEGLPDIPEAGAREFFVQALAGLMDSRQLDRDAVVALVARETDRLRSDEGRVEITNMMPTCQLMKTAAGL